MPLMLDTVQIHIPFLDRHCQPVPQSKKWELVHCVSELDRYLTVSAKNVVKKDGQIINIDYFHPYESIPTSFTGIGFKVMDTSNQSMPHVILNCSVAKILQGHNVYGNTDMISGVFEMLGVFCHGFGALVGMLDFNNAYLAKFDVTLPALTPSRKTAESIRDYLRNVDYGRFRNLSISNKKAHYNTLYFGSEGSRVGGFKIYCKGVELDKQLGELTQAANKGNIKALKDLQVYTKDVKDYADKSVRIEVTVKKRMLIENNLPTNLWQFLQYQLLNPSIYENLYIKKTGDFMSALSSMNMPYADDIKVYDTLCKKLATITPSGKLSTTKAKHAYNFYKRLKDDGFLEVKSTTDERTFRRNVKSLCDAGFSRAYLQNLAKHSEVKIIRLLNLDLNARLPDSYRAPASNYYHKFQHYLLKAA